MGLKASPTLPATTDPAARIREILAFSLCENAVADNDLLSKWSSLDVVEAVVACEQALGIPEIDEDRLIRCKTIGDLIRIFS
jgi:acyl carrier protein